MNIEQHKVTRCRNRIWVTNLERFMFPAQIAQVTFSIRSILEYEQGEKTGRDGKGNEFIGGFGLLTNRGTDLDARC